jgi:hypothetical protein
MQIGHLRHRQGQPGVAPVNAMLHGEGLRHILEQGGAEVVIADDEL